MINIFILLSSLSFIINNKVINNQNFINDQKVFKNQNLKNNIPIFMKFEEIDGDYDFDGNLINKTKTNISFPKPKLQNIQNINYDETNDMWIIDINSSKINLKDIQLNMEHEINETHKSDDFPSFYEFMRKRELKEIKEKEQYLNKKNNHQNIELNEYYEPTSKDLKLLTSFSAIEWAKTWIYEMIHVPDYFPTFMYQDMFRMRDFGQKNKTKEYFFIGYYPIDVNLKHGPFYIGAFELVPSMREFRTHIIIQNPYHCAEKLYDEEKIKNFKKELIAMCSDACVFFKFNNLQNTSDQRYFYSWLYEE
jgi:hypothetical protein